MINLAWKNIWRNKNRTIIAVLSIVLAFFLAVFFRSMSEGSYEDLLDTAVRSSSGYLQVMSEAYAKERSFDNLLADSPEILERLKAIPDVATVVPRLDSYALAITNQGNQGITLIGTRPGLEQIYSNISGDIVKGRWLRDQEKGIVISEGLSRLLNLGIGNKVDLLGQGYHGASAIGSYPVVGILRFSNPQQNNATIYIPLSEAQNFTGASGLISGWLIDIKSPRGLKQIRRGIEKLLLSPGIQEKILPHGMKEKVLVRTWEEMMPEIRRMMDSMDESLAGLINALYVIAFFGIFGTLLAMTLERKRELSTFLAIGMSPGYVNAVQLLEGALLGLVGTVIALFISLSVLIPLAKNPIPLSGEMAEQFIAMGSAPVLDFTVSPGLFVNEAGTVLIIVLFSLVLPCLYPRTLKIAESIRR